MDREERGHPQERVRGEELLGEGAGQGQGQGDGTTRTPGLVGGAWQQFLELQNALRNRLEAELSSEEDDDVETMEEGEDEEEDEGLGIQYHDDFGDEEESGDEEETGFTPTSESLPDHRRPEVVDAVFPYSHAYLGQVESISTLSNINASSGGSSTSASSSGTTTGSFGSNGDFMLDLEDDSCIGREIIIPIVPLRGVVLFPGQTIPLRSFGSYQIQIGLVDHLLAHIFGNLTSNDNTTRSGAGRGISYKVFGIVTKLDRPLTHASSLVEQLTGCLGSVGTLAELVGIGTATPSNSIVAKGKRRFKLVTLDPPPTLEIKARGGYPPGLLMATVRILNDDAGSSRIPQGVLDPFPRLGTQKTARSTAAIITKKRKTEQGQAQGIEGVDSSERERSGSTSSGDEVKDVEEPSLSSRPLSLGHFPYWVLAQFDSRALADQARELIRSSYSSVSSSSIEQALNLAPTDPTRFSFWIASNMPLEDAVRLKLLELESTVERLRNEIKLLTRIATINCKECMAVIAPQTELFSMSIGGPVGTYVNPAGFVHETITLRRARGLISVGRPQTRDSWFPGYGWTIAYCATCRAHMGWRFEAPKNSKLEPTSFWGIRRPTICQSTASANYNFNDGSYPFHPHPNPSLAVPTSS